MFKRLVIIVEIFALVAFAFWAVMLFANEPAPLEVTARQAQGRDVFIANCSRCHGGDALGGIGPAIAGYNSERQFPDVNDQIALVAAGRGKMPAWEGKLSAEEIVAVVDYVRNVLRE